MAGGPYRGGSGSPSSTTTITAFADEDDARQRPASASDGAMSRAVAGTASQGKASQQRETGQQQPKRKRSSVRVIVWQAWLWLAGTFPLSMLEMWERALIALFVIGLTLLIWYSLFFHFPDHVRKMAAKGTYYLYGKLSHASTASSMAGSSDALNSMSQKMDSAAEALLGHQRRMAGEL